MILCWFLQRGCDSLLVATKGLRFSDGFYKGVVILCWLLQRGCDSLMVDTKGCDSLMVDTNGL